MKKNLVPRKSIDLIKDIAVPVDLQGQTINNIEDLSIAIEHSYNGRLNISFELESSEGGIFTYPKHDVIHKYPLDFDDNENRFEGSIVGINLIGNDSLTVSVNVDSETGAFGD